jgi:tetratricopeptide (TPR) repeat protein
VAVTPSESLRAAGDLLGAADAEALLMAFYQEEGRGELVRRQLERLRELVDVLEPSMEKAAVLVEICRSRMMSGEHEEAIRVGEEAVALCDELGLDELRAAALNCMGASRPGIGDSDGALADLERGTAIGLSLGSYEAAHGYGNLADVYLGLGDLPRSWEARRLGLEQSERLGLRWYVRWLRMAELVELFYARGAWDEALTLAAELRERTVLAIPVHEARARIGLARGDLAGALADAEDFLTLTAESRDRQVVVPALALGAFAKLAAGERDECSVHADELLEAAQWVSPLMQFSAAPLLGFVLQALGRTDELERRTSGIRNRSPWLEAGLASASGDFARAADVYERIGDRPDEAYARLRAAEQLVAEGRGSEARDQLDRALAFFRSVGATAYLDRAEALTTLR